jgi:hypothetical protein
VEKPKKGLTRSADRDRKDACQREPTGLCSSDLKMTTHQAGSPDDDLSWSGWILDIVDREVEKGCAGGGSW